MRSHVVRGFLSGNEVDSILRDEVVQKMKNKCVNGENDVGFTVGISRFPSVFAKIGRHVDLGLSAPMR